MKGETKREMLKQGPRKEQGDLGPFGGGDWSSWCLHHFISGLISGELSQ